MSEKFDEVCSATLERGAHLYVFQSSCGRVKIGRSQDPKKRAKGMASAVGRKIKVSAIFRGRGDEERSVHSALKSHRTMGEWFAATPECRAAIRELLGPMVFPYTDALDRRVPQATEPEEADHATAVARLVEQMVKERPFRVVATRQTLAKYQVISNARRAAYLGKLAGQ